MFFIYSGWGIAVALAVAATFIIVQLLVDALFGPGYYTANSSFYAPLAFTLSAVPVYLTGAVFNGGENKHRFFFIPMENWSLILLVGGVSWMLGADVPGLVDAVMGLRK